MNAGEARDLAARTIACLDLTNLDENCGADDVTDLCQAARTPHGDVAAVCVWPHFIEQAREELKDSEIRVATVANFPCGGGRELNIIDSVEDSLRAGAHEIDVVLPYRAFMKGDYAHVDSILKVVKKTCRARPMKVIIESGELQRPELIRFAADLAISNGADFVKTSTGKSAVGATPEGVGAILQMISIAGRPVGLKVSGGVRSFADARRYVTLAQQAFGPDFIKPETFRIGASSLLTELLKCFDDKTGAASPGLEGGY